MVVLQAAAFQPVLRLNWPLLQGVRKRISADHMGTPVCLPSRIETHIVGSVDKHVIIETEDKR